MLTDWIAALDGTPVRQRTLAQGRALGVGHYRFGGLPDYVCAPEIAHHYVSVALAADVDVEGILSGARHRARVRAGQVIVMAAGQDNTWRWSKPVEEAHVFLEPWLLSDVADEVGAPAPEIVNRCAIDDDRIRHIVLGMVEELDHRSSASRALLETGARYLAHHLLRRHCTRALPPLKPGGLSPAQLRKVEALAADDLSQDLGLSELAGAAGLSPYHFARRFKASTGETPHAWLTRLRMEKARHLIAATGLAMIEIAHSVGFESQSHFGQVFRTSCGVTPAEFRRRSRC